jgi:hypothetical protein
MHCREFQTMKVYHFFGILGSIATIVGVVIMFEPFNSMVNNKPTQQFPQKDTVRIIERTEKTVIEKSVNITQVPPANDGKCRIPNLFHMKYTEARDSLINAGWIPLLHHWSYSQDNNVKWGNGPVFWKKGYWEIENSSGTGIACCEFIFKDPSGRKLEVVTGGMQAEDGHTSAIVLQTNIKQQQDE